MKGNKRGGPQQLVIPTKEGSTPEYELEKSSLFTVFSSLPFLLNKNNSAHLWKLMRKSFVVYIVTNFSRTVLYTAVTNDLEQRILEHYLDRGNQKTFAGKYQTHYLIFFERSRYINNAIEREKEIKGWGRKKKVELINGFNPQWKFLNEEIFDKWPPENMRHRKKE